MNDVPNKKLLQNLYCLILASFSCIVLILDHVIPASYPVETLFIVIVLSSAFLCEKPVTHWLVTLGAVCLIFIGYYVSPPDESTQYPFLNRILVSLIVIISSFIYDIYFRAQRKSKLLEMRFETTFNATPNGMVMVDSNGVIQLVNEELLRLFEYEKSELIGQHIETLIPVRYRNDHVLQRNHYLKNPDKRPMGKGRDLFGLKKSGKEFPIEIGLNPLRTSNGVYVLSSIIDITARKHLENSLRHQAQQLSEMNKDLKHLDKIKDEFVTVITHELRTPLGAIMEAISLVIDGVDGELNHDQKDTLTLAQKNVERLARLVSNVLDFQKLNSDEQLTNLSLANINAIINEVADSLRYEADAKEIKIDIDSPLDPITIECDSDRIKQVLFNLGHNAVKFTPENGKVTFGLTLDGTLCCFSVRDTGPGIPKEDHKKIFDMFGQSHTKGYWRTGGSGVGLAVCKKIIDAHKGNITVKSKLNHGSTFVCAIPLRQ